MSRDSITHLNGRESSPFFSKLEATILASQQGKASAPQWAAMIRALTQKGVKEIEIAESAVLGSLDSMDTEEVLTKIALARRINAMTFTIKEVGLGTPQYAAHRQPGGEYTEYLYIANSERDNVNEELETVEYEMEVLAFDMGAEDLLERLSALEIRRTALIDRQPLAIDFVAPHFSREIQGKHGRNLMAHCRTTVRGDIYFIEEIQSDWAQRGRQQDWGTIPKGPMVTNTEAWAGMVLRRQMQIAARNPAIKHVAWMTSSMRNGGQQNLPHETSQADRAKARKVFIAQTASEVIEKMTTPDMTKEQTEMLKSMARTKGEHAADVAGFINADEGMNAFYMTMLPNLADKVLKGTGEKVMIKTLDLKNERMPVAVPTIEMTPAVRDKLMAAQPMYSRALLNPTARSADEEGLTEMLRRVGAMVGSAKHIHLVAAVRDIATGKRVAGRYINGFMEAALDAKDIDEVADHEAFHYAEDRMLSQREKQVMLDNFQPGGELHFQVQDALIRRGDHSLALECQDPKEAAAQGFALWRKGQLDAAPVPVTGIFSDLVNAFKDVLSWLRREVLEQKLQTVEEIYEALNGGELARRAQEQQERYLRAGMTNRY